MADIKLTDLTHHNIFGDDLFKDSESFMLELNDDEYIRGGIFQPICQFGGNGDAATIPCYEATESDY
jgi:hypothetical protein